MAIFHPDRRGVRRIPTPAREALALPAVLVLAALVRFVAAGRHEALGQSDAYAHLQFLQDVLATGRLRHPLYPPFYHLLLAVPTRLFRWDPYMVVRFAGVFFGTLLVGAVYGLARRAFGKRAALWSAFLVAACPLFHHLQKTGVGAFPNQLGLLLVPLLLWAWDAAGHGRWSAALAGVTLSALLAATVPVMLLDLLPLLALDLVLHRRGRFAPPLRLLVISGLALAAAGAAVVFLRGLGPPLIRTLGVMAGLPSPEGQPPAAALGNIFWALIRPKRWGLPGGLAGAGAAVLGLGGVIAVWRLRDAPTAARLVALWGLLAWAQTVFGVFQFALYWRAGWTLLTALAIGLGAWLEAFPRGRPPWARAGGVAQSLTLASAVFSFLFPPAPQPHLSAAEDDLVRFALELRAWHDGTRIGRSPSWINELAGADHVAVWTRVYFGNPDLQGEPLHAFLENRTRIRLHALRPEDVPRLEWPTDCPSIVVLDDRVVPVRPSWASRLANPALTRDFEQGRARWMEAGRRLRECAEAAERAGWTVRRYQYPHGLEILWLHPPRPMPSTDIPPASRPPTHAGQTPPMVVLAGIARNRA